MRFYQSLSRLFPKWLWAKVAVILFFVTLVPVLVALGLAQEAWLVTDAWPVFVVGNVMAGLLALCLGVVLLHWLLEPVRRVNRALARYATERVLTPMPLSHSDELGQLMTNSTRLMHEVGHEIDAALVAAETDALTGLMNRRGFERLVPPAACGTILVIDIDHFKRVNDEWGHAVGDATLVSIADAISAALRTRDVVARLGGEEFAVFAEETVESRALDVAERVRLRVRNTVSVWRRPVTVSIGVAVSSQVIEREILTSIADDALYDAKANGRDCVVLGAIPRAA